ncbi:hypothetical protein [Neobacillus muris]|uniref:hypothetical protein n=1 Tax=Neobacillus muris TaxID=2941334 RepID=UPI00203C1476|nr:hypothetical protein [Neobacillus muris]
MRIHRTFLGNTKMDNNGQVEIPFKARVKLGLQQGGKNGWLLEGKCRRGLFDAILQSCRYTFYGIWCMI